MRRKQWHWHWHVAGVTLVLMRGERERTSACTIVVVACGGTRRAQCAITVEGEVGEGEALSSC